MLKKATVTDAGLLAELAVQMWPGHSVQELEKEFAKLLRSADVACFLAFYGESQSSAGFAQCQLRYDYVEGTKSSPVGYLEGIFVKEGCRGRGLARAMLSECENWAREKGCSEFASDCELENTASFHFHKSVGFAEAGRIICFTRRLG